MKKIWTIIKKCSSVLWKLIAGVAVVIGLVAAYYQLFVTAPSILSQITSETNVLDVHQPVANLQVLFQGANVQEKNQNLKIYRVGFENNGGTNITQNDFDQNNNWGIRVDNGSIIEARLATSQSDYVVNNLQPTVQNNNFVKFNKIIFDKGASFVVEILVLHEKNTPPILYRVGKIAGIRETESRLSLQRNEESFLKALSYGSFYGSFSINLVRFVLYAIVSLTLFILLILFFAKLNEKRMKAGQGPLPPQQPS